MDYVYIVHGTYVLSLQLIEARKKNIWVEVSIELENQAQCDMESESSIVLTVTSFCCLLKSFHMKDVNKRVLRSDRETEHC